MRPLNALSRRRFGGVLLGATVAALLGHGPKQARGAPSHHRVEIRGFSFQPATLTLRAGDKVEWTNHDIAPHTVTDMNGDWSSEELARHDSHVQSFDESGRFDYFCAYHPHMTARLIVTAG